MPQSLSPRQLECATLFAHGMQAQEIGRRLNIQTSTVETHIAKAYERLQVNGRPALRRALGIEYGGQSVGIPDGLIVGPDRPVGEAPEAAQMVRDDRFLLGFYRGLGSWRTPPRPPGGRFTVVLAIAGVSVSVFGTMFLILAAIYAVLDSAGLWQ